VYNKYVRKRAELAKRRKEDKTMKELKSKIGAYYDAKQAMYDAEHEALRTIAEAVAENGNTFCGDIAEASGVPSCVVNGMMQRAKNRRLIKCDGRRMRHKVYARLNPDGSVDTDDTLTVSYSALCYHA
jgi:hypothetical protein